MVHEYAVRYVVPYVVAPSRTTLAASGRLTVYAVSTEDAMLKARAIHEGGRYAVTPALPAGGPGASGAGSYRSKRGLSKAERSHIHYGTPVELAAMTRKADAA